MRVEGPSMVENLKWATQVNEGLNRVQDIPMQSEIEDWKKRSIYKVPERITALNPKAYKPLVVSFGPYHHGQPCLLPMEEHKHRVLLHFLKRCGKPVDRFIFALDAIAGDMMASYYPLDHNKWKKDDFVKMMLFDGCFMLEIHRSDPDSLETATGYASNDPIFSAHGKLHVMPVIMRDMMKLENQLPMLVLDKILSVEMCGEQVEESSDGLFMKLYCPDDVPKTGKCLHYLDIVRKSLLGDVETASKQGSSSTMEHKSVYIRIPARSATDLAEAGIEFRKSKTESLTDIEFKHGVLRLPVLQVFYGTEHIFLNLIAYEHCHMLTGNDVASYVYFLDCIIDSERDVALLRSRGIIENLMGSDKAAAELFNSLTKEVPFDPASPLHKVLQEVNDYCNKAWNKWRANLIHTYFTNPWAILSLMAAIFLFALTIVQTVYSVLGARNHN